MDDQVRGEPAHSESPHRCHLRKENEMKQNIAFALVVGTALAFLMTCAWSLQSVEPLVLPLESSFVQTQDVCEVDSEFIEMLMAQTVYIQNETGTGSGVVIDSERGLILTAAHGQCDKYMTYVYFSATCGYKVEPSQVTVYPAYDLAVLDLGVDLLVAVSPVRTGYPEIGEEIIVVGSPVGWKYFNTVSFGRITGLLRRLDGLPHLFWYQTDAVINRGNSGGPWFDMQGRLIAITLKKANAEGIAFGLPIRYLLEAREEAD